MTNLQRISVITTMMLLFASTAFSGERPLCPKLFGKSITVTGKIVDAYVSDGAAKYDLAPEDSPCLSLYFSVVDPNGKLRCQKGQQITATGIVKDNGLGADLSTSDYSCK
jgi:hypothetical protein